MTTRRRRVKIAEGLVMSIPGPGVRDVIAQVVAVDPGVVLVSTHGAHERGGRIDDAHLGDPELIALVSGYDISVGEWPELARRESIRGRVELPSYVHGLRQVRIRSFDRAVDVPLVGPVEDLRRERSYSDNVLRNAALALLGQADWSERYSRLLYDDWRAYAEYSNRRLRESLDG